MPWSRVLVALVLAGCTAVRRRADGDLVHDLAFEGNGGPLSGHDDYHLRGQIQQGEAGFGLLTWPLVYTVDPVTLDRERLARDAYRLEVWYAHHGWFDARVAGWEVHTIRRGTTRRASVVDVTGFVEPGPQSKVRALSIRGLPPALEAVGNAVLRQAPIRVGDPYDLALIEETRAALALKLVNYSRPYATVEVTATADPAAQVVDVALVASPGIIGRFGEIRVSGNEVVDAQWITDALNLDPGASYSMQALQDAQRRLFGLGTFSLATVRSDLSDPTRASVPVDVDLTESRFRTFRVGGGFDYDGYVPVIRASTRLSHVNLFGRMIKGEITGEVGYAFDLSEEGAAIGGGQATWGAAVSLVYPRLFGPRASLSLTADMEQDVYVGLWAYRRPAVDLAVTYRFSDQVQLRVGPHFEDYVFLDDYGDRIAQAQDQLFGLQGSQDFEYRLSALDQLFTVDWRDDPLSPSRGTYWTLAAREAAPISDLGYGFVRGSAEVRGFVPVRARDRSSVYPVVLAGRAAVTAIAPYGDTETIPLPERAFLGGPNSLRGFRPKQVGGYRPFCVYSAQDDGTEALVRYNVPQGATNAAEVGTELRYDWIYGVTVAWFAEGGYLSNRPIPTAADLRGSVGTGIRYRTPVGPVRLDVSVRPTFPEDTEAPNYVGCRLEDQTPRVYDLLSMVPAWRGEAHPGFAVVFFLTLGEAF
ncbi:MAG: BamA/TamA family outer membrane protein [Myxococcota bacterium]